MSAQQFHEVGQFHHKFGLDNITYDSAPGPREVDPNLLEFRRKFLHEELTEFEEGIIAGDHAKMFDSLIDLVYIAYGTAHLMGYPWEEGWIMVQRANMLKERSTSTDAGSDRGSSFDIVKPPGWTPPDIEGLLAEFGWID